MNNDNKKYNYSKADVESRDFNNHYDLNIDYDAFKYYVDKGFSNSKFDFFSKRYNFENSNNKDLEKIFNKVKTERFLKKDHKIFPSISVDRRKIINKNFNINDIETLFIEVFKRLIDDDLSKKEFVLTEKLERISYVGPLRPHPKRMYALNNNNTNSVGVTGENFLNFLTYDEKYLDLVNKVLVDFGIKYKIELQRNDNDVVGDTVSVLLRHRSNNLITTLVDVGFGIGQLLPILIEGLVKRKSTICIEQPEIHLHPKLQADLATFFAKDILSDKGNQWIIETHSEALLLRFQRLIRHKILKPEDISIIYIDPQDEGVKTLHIPLDDEGDFTIEWPYGFFEERIEEIFGGNPLKDGN